jgi:sugar transferase EpsL
MAARGYEAQKRAFDATVAAVGLVVGAPVLAVVAALVRWRLGAPVLFRQWRPGRDGVPFELYKFRTMTDARGPDGALRPDAERLAPLGRWLRRTSLDELPELVNVLRGDMSLVGPRPLLMDYLEHYDAAQARRHEVRPGLTGWAQVNGRNATTWAARFAYDVEYVERRGWRLDLVILARTVTQVLRGAGVTAPGEATMPRFAGGPDGDGDGAAR